MHAFLRFIRNLALDRAAPWGLVGAIAGFGQLAGVFAGHCLHDNNGLPRFELLQLVVRALQAGDADMVTACQATERIALAYNVLDGAGAAIAGGGQVHVERFEFVFSYVIFTVDRY